MNQVVDFGSIFKRSAADGERQHHAIIGGSISGLSGLGGVTGRWDRYDDTTELVIVWSGTFDVHLSRTHRFIGAGQCVVPVGV